MGTYGTWWCQQVSLRLDSDVVIHGRDGMEDYKVVRQAVSVPCHCKEACARGLISDRRCCPRASS